MADFFSGSDDPSSPARERTTGDPAPQPFLKVTPRHFFSTRFDTEIIEDYDQTDPDARDRSRDPRPGRVLPPDLLVLIVVVGIPLLIYCIWSTAT